MRSSYGGIGYHDIMNMGYGEIFEIGNAFSNHISKENKETERLSKK